MSEDATVAAVVPEKPLHVRVAEALGWRYVARRCPDGGGGATFYAAGDSEGVDADFGGVAPDTRCSVAGHNHHPVAECTIIEAWDGSPVGHTNRGVPLRWVWSGVPRYDTDWAATGPLIERLRIWVFPDTKAKEFYWEATQDPGPDGLAAEGETPLLAVCNLILALHAAGKLPPAP